MRVLALNHREQRELADAASWAFAAFGGAGAALGASPLFVGACVVALCVALRLKPYDWNNDEDRRRIRVLARSGAKPQVLGHRWVRVNDREFILVKDEEVP